MKLSGATILILAGLMTARCARAASPSDTRWSYGSGLWTDMAHWSAGLPNAYGRAEVHGNSTVVVPAGNYLIANLEIGLNNRDHARVEVDGGKLILLQDSLRVGELGGGSGEFILKDGAMHTFMDTYVGAANGVPGRATRAALVIQGGSFLSRAFYVGSGWGANSCLAIEGSGASAIHILNCAYLEGHAGADGQPAAATLSFTIDEHGVTPITIQSKRDGLRIFKDATSQCRLQIQLSAVPPREDIVLVSGNVPIKGTFDGCPEGCEIKADYERKTYRWQLTYRGGSGNNDLVLINKSTYAPNEPVTHVRAMPEIPKPLWSEHALHRTPVQTNSEPAFAGAEGFGAFTPGGRGGKIIFVDNLNDSGPGSLREAVKTPGPRVISFRVGGAIPLKSTLIINEPFITIDGQDAPGPGILLRNHGVEVRTHDVVLRYFRVRVGDDDVHLDDPRAKESYYGGTGEHALYFIEGSKNCIADHLSLSWSTTKILSINHLCDLITVQWCILSEGLNFADHGLGVIIGQGRLTWHHNLIAHCQSRNPRFASLVDADFRNNVVYNWGDTAGLGEFDRVNYIGNYLKPGPSTRKEQRLFHDGVDVVMPNSLFVTNNILEGNDKVNRDNWLGVGYDRATIGAAEPFPAPSVTTDSPREAFDQVLKDAGATLPRRDAVDDRIVREAREGKGHIIKWVKDAGGWPDFPPTTTTVDNTTK